MVTDIDAAGDGVATEAGVAIRVPGGLPGDRVEFRIEARSRHRPLAEGRLLRVLEPSPDRRAAPCEHHPSRGGDCCGCALLELHEPAQREAKRRYLARLGLQVPALIADERPLGYRFSSKRVAGGRPGALRLGSYRRGSHDVAAMRRCRVEHPRLTEVAAEVEDAANRLGVEPWDERSRRGDLRAVWLRTDGERVLVGLVVAGPGGKAATGLPAALRGAAGVAVALHRGDGNSLHGAGVVSERGVATLHVGPGEDSPPVGVFGFLQPNPLLAAAARATLLEAPDGTALGGELALDLYAGSGALTARARRCYRSVLPVESSPESAALLGVEATSVEDYLERALADPRHAARAADLVLANPPRRGLGERVTAALVALGPPRIHLMSCGPEGLARDLTALAAGGYRCVGLAAWDLLPQTPHVELVAWLARG